MPENFADRKLNQHINAAPSQGQQMEMTKLRNTLGAYYASSAHKQLDAQQIELATRISKTQQRANAIADERFGEMALTPRTDQENLAQTANLDVAQDGFKNMLVEGRGALKAGMFGIPSLGAILVAAGLLGGGPIEILLGAGAGLLGLLWGAGFRTANVEELAQQRLTHILAMHTEKYVREWLQNVYGITPVRGAFETDQAAFVNVINNQTGTYRFKAEDGNEYNLDRIVQHGSLWISGTMGYVHPKNNGQLPKSFEQRLQRKGLLPARGEMNDPAYPAAQPVTEPTAKPADELSPFSPRDRARILSFGKTIAGYDAQPQDEETKFKLDQMRELLGNIIRLGGKLDGVKTKARRDGFAELETALDTVEQGLKGIETARDNEVLREAKILGQYSKNIRGDEDGGELDLTQEKN